METIKKAFAEKSALELATILCEIAVEHKAENLVLLDVKRISGFTDYFLILSGRSTRHVQGLASAFEQKLSRKRLNSSKAEGFDEGHWVLLDFNDVIVHIFYYEDRQVFDLEGLWHDAPRVDLSKLSKLEALP